MSASLVYELVPIGSMLSWSDGTPQPPAHHRKKLGVWKTNNGSGRLIRKEAPRSTGTCRSPACFTIHEGDYGSAGTIVLRVHRSFDVESCRLAFAVVELPAIGSVRVFDRAGDGAVLVHVAADCAAAEEWLSRHGYPQAVLEEVTHMPDSTHSVTAAA